MARIREKRPERKMKPVFLVFCEGETEESYLDFLRRSYRSPIKIIAKTEGGSISPNLINQRRKEIQISKNEKVSTFLMYDLDKPDVNVRLDKCNATWLCSNPCIEIWFLLHCKNQENSLSTKQCITALKSIDTWSQYDKSGFSQTQISLLWLNRTEAVRRAKGLKEFQNPSSSIYRLLEALEQTME